jgi:magnesium chelatase subunit D
MAFQIILRERILHPDVNPMMILLTDGAGNVSMTHLPPQEESNRLANQIADENIHCIVINMEHAAFDQGLAQSLADHLKAPCYTLSELKAETLYQTVRDEMVTPRSG